MSFSFTLHDTQIVATPFYKIILLVICQFHIYVCHRKAQDNDKSGRQKPYRI